jgi:hypothetical protein
VSGLLTGLHHGDQQGLHPGLEELLDQYVVALGWAHHRLGVVGGDRLQLGEDRAQIVGAMLGVDQQPVKARPGTDLGTEDLGQPQPQAILHVARPQALLEAVFGKIHCVQLQVV